MSLDFTLLDWDYDRELVLPVKFPKINSVPDTKKQPFWSVVLPVCDRFEYLEQAINSVLAQDINTNDIEIIVVDNASTTYEMLQELISRVGRNQVSYVRFGQRVGMSENWNRCIELSSGRWVHILHDDDFLRTGFYKKLQSVLERSDEYGLAFTRYISVNESGCWLNVSTPLQENSGKLEQQNENILEFSKLCAPSVVVKREMYERVGGFFPGLVFASDWEMWKRVSLQCGIYFELEPLICYRYHEGSETARLLLNGVYILDVFKAMRITQSLMSEYEGKYWYEKAEKAYVKVILATARLRTFPKKSIAKQVLAILISARQVSTYLAVISASLRLTLLYVIQVPLRIVEVAMGIFRYAFKWQ